MKDATAVQGVRTPHINKGSDQQHPASGWQGVPAQRVANLVHCVGHALRLNFECEVRGLGMSRNKRLGRVLLRHV
jgi:predicted cobalt transporter CbtA